MQKIKNKITDAEIWLAKISAENCKSDRQAKFLISLAAGHYRTILTKELKAKGFSLDD